jgi:NADH-quinone oxidoreductase subunit K
MFELIMVTAIILGTVGVYGVISRRNPIKMLLSIEVIFNGMLLLLLYFSWLSSPLGGASLVILLIALAVGEIALIFTILMALVRFGMVGKLDVDEFMVKEEE